MERPAPSAGEVRDALERVLGAPAFAGARRSGDLLRYIVEAALKTPGRAIKEQELGAEALGRGDRFDPRFDPIARVEASRLRTRLAQHYTAEGASDPVRINLPKGGYSPVFAHRADKADAAHAAVANWRGRIIWSATGAAVAAAFLALVLALIPRPANAPPREPLTFDAALGAPGVLADQVGNSLALSPDGRTLVTVLLGDDGNTRLYARRLDSIEAVELPGTEGGYQPFFSPDSRWVGFFSAGKLKKTLLDGPGTPVAIAEMTDAQGLSWGEDGMIFASVFRDASIQRIPDDGGAWTTIPIETSSGAWTGWPQALPRGKGILYNAVDRQSGQRRIEAVRIDGRKPLVIASTGTYPRYSPTGDVLYVDRGTLFAVKFDVDTFELKGQPRPVVHDVAYREPFGHAFYDVSPSGTFVYMRSRSSLIVWLDGGDKVRPLLSVPDRYLFPRLSPDGRRLAYGVAEGPGYGLYVMDIGSGETERIGGADSGEGNPMWTHDGRNIIVLANKTLSIAWRRADGAGEAHSLIPGINVPWTMNAEGTRIAYHGLSTETHFDLWTAPITSGSDGVTAGTPEVFLQTPAIETFPAISPDGKWMAYNSNTSGDFSVYVQPFPEGGQPVKLANGGRVALWAEPNRIFYTTGDHRLMVVSYSIRNGEFVPGLAQPWSDLQLSDIGVLSNYHLSADGKQVVALVPDLPKGARERDHASFILNFFDLLGEKH